MGSEQSSAYVGGYNGPEGRLRVFFSIKTHPLSKKCLIKNVEVEIVLNEIVEYNIVESEIVESEIVE